MCNDRKMVVFTVPPSHSVGGQTSNGRRRLSSSSVTLHGRPAVGFTRAVQAMTACCLSNYGSTGTLRGGPVVLRHVRVTFFVCRESISVSVLLPFIGHQLLQVLH